MNEWYVEHQLVSSLWVVRIEIIGAIWRKEIIKIYLISIKEYLRLLRAILHSSVLLDPIRHVWCAAIYMHSHAHWSETNKNLNRLTAIEDVVEWQLDNKRNMRETFDIRNRIYVLSRVNELIGLNVFRYLKKRYGRILSPLFLSFFLSLSSCIEIKSKCCIPFEHKRWHFTNDWTMDFLQPIDGLRLTVSHTETERCI